MSQFEDIKNIVKEEEGNYQKIKFKFDLGEFDDDDDEEPTIHWKKYGQYGNML